MTNGLRAATVVWLGGGRNAEEPGTWSASNEWLVQRLSPRFPELNLRFFVPLQESASTAEASDAIPKHPTLGQALFLLRHGAEIAHAREKGQDSKVAKLLAAGARSGHHAR